MLPETFDTEQQKEDCISYIGLAEEHWGNILSLLHEQKEPIPLFTILKNNAFNTIKKKHKEQIFYPKNGCFLCEYVKTYCQASDKTGLNCPACPGCWGTEQTADKEEWAFYVPCEKNGSPYLTFIEYSDKETRIPACLEILQIIRKAKEDAKKIPVTGEKGTTDVT